MNPRLAYPAIWIVGWLALVLVSLYSRSFLPVDETRYVSVAWEMWLRGDFLVPFKNGLPHSHKPPLLFWMMHLGWSIFGVNEWWPRIMPSLFALGSLFLTARLARSIWPDERRMAWLAPTIVFGCLFWAAFTPMAMFDMVLTFWVLLGITGVWQAAQGDRRGWWLLIAGIGLGILTKGPVALLQVLPVAVLAPWWSPRVRQAKLHWYGLLVLSVLAGALVVLAWAIPAGIHGGEVYRNAIFWGQTAGRIAKSFAHQREWWWYLPSLPLVLFPWFIWWPAWRGLKDAGQGLERDHFRFLLAWMIPVFIAFSAISGKQLHYLLPLYPALAMLVSAGLLRHQQVSVRSILPVALVLLGLSVVLIMVPGLQEKRHLPGWVASIPAWGGVSLLAVSGLLMWSARKRQVCRHVTLLALTGVATVLVLFLAVLRPAAPFYDISKPARVIAGLQSRQVPVAYLGKYHAQFQFAGRLKKPVTVLMPEQLGGWIKAHPDGRIIVNSHRNDEALISRAERSFPFRGRWLLIVRARDWKR